MNHTIFLTTAFCLFLSYSIFAQDSIVITTCDDIHIVNPYGVEKGIPSPNQGSSKMICIAGYKC
jgi:hypothetical protein